MWYHQQVPDISIMFNKTWFCFSLVWTFPFTYITQAKPNETIEIWITGKTQNHTMTPARENGTCDGWIVGNVNRTGLYRVNYEMENWKSLSELFQSNHTVFSTESRKGLLDDAFTLARCQHGVKTKGRNILICVS